MSWPDDELLRRMLAELAGDPGEHPDLDTLADYLLGPNRYALQVKGDSMIGIGILNGDLVIIERCDTADDGAIVVALIDDEEATLKRLKRLKSGRIKLIAENPDISPFTYAAKRVRIQGVLVCQLRRYQ